jgi:uncharacterized protein YjcR
MTDEQRKEICKAFYIHKMTVNEIAEAFNIDPEEVGKAVAWGEQTHYTDELSERGI